jgi:hypothetical protein
MAEKTIGEANVRPAFHTQGVIVAIICIDRIILDIAGIFILGLTTGTVDICIPNLTIDIKGIHTHDITIGIIDSVEIGKLFCYQNV